MQPSASFCDAHNFDYGIGIDARINRNGSSADQGREGGTEQVQTHVQNTWSGTDLRRFRRRSVRNRDLLVSRSSFRFHHSVDGCRNIANGNQHPIHLLENRSGDRARPQRSHSVNGKHSIETAADAALALKPFAGEFATWLLALGVIGTGLLAIPVLVGSASYAIGSAFGWRRGFGQQWYRAKPFYVAIGLATLIGIAINFLNIKPMQALYWTAIMNGLLAPPLLVLIMLISNDKKIVGDKVNAPFTQFLGWLTTIVMFAGAIALIVTSIPTGN